VNFRRSLKGKISTSIKNLIKYKWPIGFLGREVIENVTSYESAVSILSNSELCSPCYITICGINKG
jgi:hypothetical protein